MKTNNIDKLFKEKVEEIENKKDIVSFVPENSWEDYKQFENNKKKQNKKRFVYALSTAAILFVFIFLFSDIFSNQSEIIFVENKTQTPLLVQISEGNIVWLNASSSVEYNKNDLTEFQVHGEAYFVFKKIDENEIIVGIDNSRIKVKTVSSFNVKSYSEDINVEIIVDLGLIEVYDENNGEGLSLLVEKGNYCSVNKASNLVYTATNDNDNFLAWKTGEFVFVNATLETVTEVLSEYYGTEIFFKDVDIAVCRISGSFNVKSLDLILNQIKKDLNISIFETGKKIVISGQSC